MKKSVRQGILAACAVTVAGTSGVVSAGGPVGTIPFDGDGSGSGFTIDNPAFDFNDVTNAPCPTGAVCTNGTATTIGELLMREVDTGVARYTQMILVDPDDGNGDFTYEATVSSGGASNAIGAKIVIDDTGFDFHSEQAVYRGALFGASALNDNLAVDVYETVGQPNGIQVFDMETTQSPDEGASLLRNGRVHIYQYKTDPLTEIELTFGHTILTGSYQTNSGTLSVGAESFTYAAGNALSATWIREIIYDAENGDIDFGALIYRGNNGATIGSGNAGGDPFVFDPLYSQDPTDYEATGISQVIIENGASFEAANNLLDFNWDEDVFGPNPY